MREAFSKANSPIWMDSSTKKQCQALTNHVGGAQNLSNITGSSSYERFSINQILKFSEDEEKWSQTESVSLISSFVVSLLIGSYAPIDFSDGSGMNILDIKKGFQVYSDSMAASANQMSELESPNKSKTWNEKILNFCGKGMKEKLGEPIAAEEIVGEISDYFKIRYGLAGRVIAATGDNPSSFAGLNIGSRDICLSMGTSDTVMMAMENPNPQVEGHVFVNPIDKESYMGMLCYKNGSLTRQMIRDKYNLTWDEFGGILKDSAPTSGL